MILFSPGLIRAFLFSDINIFNSISSSGVYACLKELKKTKQLTAIKLIYSLHCNRVVLK